MIKMVVIPFGRSGIVGGIMLGLGRALGETIVVYALISPMFDFTTKPLAERHQHHRLAHRVALLRVGRHRARRACSERVSCCSCSPSSSTPLPASW